MSTTMIRSRRPGRAVGAATAVAAALALGACSGGGGNADGGTGGAEAGGGDTEAASTTCDTVTVWHYFSADNQVQLMEDYATMFEESQDGVTVENVFQPYDQLNSKTISAVGAGEGPDVVVFNGAEWSTLALAGALMPLDEYWGEFADAAQFSDAVLHGTDEDMFAVQGYVNLLGLWYNADILEEIGVEPPETLEELEAAMAAAKEAGHMGITLSALPQSQGEWQAYPWLTGQGFSYADADAEALAAGFSTVRAWIEEGYLSQEAVTWDQTVPFQQFTAGGVAFAENGNWQIGAAEADADFDYGVVPLPVGEEGQVYLGGEGQGIAASSDCPDLAWDYLTETYLSTQGQITAVELVGSIPAREDAAEDPAVLENELLEPFSWTLQNLGARYPAEVIPPEAVADVQTTVGQAWSSALAGQSSPEQAAEEVMSLLENVLE